MASNLPDSIAIIGLGLMGGSLAGALREGGYTGQILGLDTDPGAVSGLRQRGWIDREADLSDCSGAGLIILATPLNATRRLIAELSIRVRPPTILTDLASVKLPMQLAAAEHLSPGTAWVGGHPMAGSERAGWQAARSDLYRGAPYFLITPAPPEALATVEAMVRRVGGRPVRIGAVEHDELVGRLSHLPHLVAAALARVGAKWGSEGAGGGFLDGTRVALGAPELWHEILTFNRSAVLAALTEFMEEMEHFRSALATGDGEELTALLRSAQEARRQIGDFRRL